MSVPMSGRRASGGVVARPVEANETAVYRFFDADGNLLYVGISNEPFKRWASHTGRVWWKSAATYTVVWYPSRTGAESAEQLAIRTEHPLRNIHSTKQHAELIARAVRIPLAVPLAAGADALLSTLEIESRFGVSRQTVHNLRRRGVFPAPVQSPGSSRLRWNAIEVAAYFEANPKQPGKKIEKRLKPPTADQ